MMAALQCLQVKDGPSPGHAPHGIDAALDQADTAEYQNHHLMEGHDGERPSDEAEHEIAPA